MAVEINLPKKKKKITDTFLGVMTEEMILFLLQNITQWERSRFTIVFILRLENYCLCFMQICNGSSAPLVKIVFAELMADNVSGRTGFHF